MTLRRAYGVGIANVPLFSSVSLRQAYGTVPIGGASIISISRQWTSDAGGVDEPGGLREWTADGGGVQETSV